MNVVSQMKISNLTYTRSTEMFYWNLLDETLNLAVLDSRCTKTVCGEEWLHCYLDTLSEKEQEEKKLTVSSYHVTDAFQSEYTL